MYMYHGRITFWAKSFAPHEDIEVKLSLTSLAYMYKLPVASAVLMAVAPQYHVTSSAETSL